MTHTRAGPTTTEHKLAAGNAGTPAPVGGYDDDDLISGRQHGAIDGATADHANIGAHDGSRAPESG